VARLGERVFDEGAVGLLHLRDAELGLRHHLHAERGQHLAELAQLAGVVACEHQPSHDSTAEKIQFKTI
jgi:hypothetical protein